MLIDCPHCAKTYHMTRDLLGETGRKIRCAACRQIWHAELPVNGPDPLEDFRISAPPAADDDISGAEIDALASSGRAVAPSYEELYGNGRPKAGKLPRPAWRLPRAPGALVAFCLTIATGMALVAERAKIVARVPGSVGLYAAIGLPVNLRGLELRNITSMLVGEGPQRVLAVEGEITNVSRAQANVPLLQVGLRGTGLREIYGWTAPAPKATLAQGETMQFRARLAAPPDNARDVTVRFAPEAEQPGKTRK